MSQDEPLHPNRQRLDEIDEEILCWDGYDDAIIGVGYRFNDGPVAVYSYRDIITTLMNEGMSEEEALEFYDYNIIGGWIGEKTPMVAVLFNKEDEMRDKEETGNHVPDATKMVCECGHEQRHHYFGFMGDMPLNSGKAICGAYECHCGDYRAKGGE